MDVCVYVHTHMCAYLRAHIHAHMCSHMHLLPWKQKDKTEKPKERQKETEFDSISAAFSRPRSLDRPEYNAARSAKTMCKDREEESMTSKGACG